jgi:hypothetical protein
MPENGRPHKANDWYEPVMHTGTPDPRKHWYCLRGPDGSCLHVRTRSAQAAREWAREAGALPISRRPTVTEGTCARTGAPLPLLPISALNAA